MAYADPSYIKKHILKFTADDFEKGAWDKLCRRYPSIQPQQLLCKIAMQGIDAWNAEFERREKAGNENIHSFMPRRSSDVRLTLSC